MNDLYEALIETSTPVVRSAPEGVEHAGGAARRAARGRRRVHRRRPAPRRRASATSSTSSPSATRRSATRCAGSSRARRPPRCTSTSACRTPRPRSSSTTACAPTCRCCRRSPRTRRSGTARTPASPAPARLTFRAFPRSTIPPAFADWDALRGAGPAGASDARRSRTTRSCGGTSGRARTSGTVEVRAMDAQSAAGDRRRPRRARPRARRRVRGRRRGADRRPPRRSRSPRSAPPATASTRRSGGAARSGRCARSARTRSPLARPYARELDGEDALEEIERVLREGGGADRMRAAHAAGGMDGLLAQLADETYGSTQTTSPIRSQL